MVWLLLYTLYPLLCAYLLWFAPDLIDVILIVIFKQPPEPWLNALFYIAVFVVCMFFIRGIRKDFSFSKDWPIYLKIVCLTPVIINALIAIGMLISALWVLFINYVWPWLKIALIFFAKFILPVLLIIAIVIAVIAWRQKLNTNHE
ncbi:hypothetical protein [Scopulibacillus darangshiensis]|uniref:hypothetical protein n=1 Tax=Scopulibacillus darangshiensis TaxID=442528 RepID=UPI00104F4898|nr:hypothetical protein [Scopulibacillus darangshiensis]